MGGVTLSMSLSEDANGPAAQTLTIQRRLALYTATGRAGARHNQGDAYLGNRYDSGRRRQPGTSQKKIASATSSNAPRPADRVLMRRDIAAASTASKYHLDMTQSLWHTTASNFAPWSRQLSRSVAARPKSRSQRPLSRQASRFKTNLSPAWANAPAVAVGGDRTVSSLAPIWRYSLRPHEMEK